MRFVVDARYAGPKPSGIGAYVRAVGQRLPELAPAERFHFWIRPGAEALAAGSNVTHRTVTAAPSSLVTLAGPRFLDTLADDDVFHTPANVLGFGVPCPAIVTVHDVMWIKHVAWCQPRPW